MLYKEFLIDTSRVLSFAYYVRLCENLCAWSTATIDKTALYEISWRCSLVPFIVQKWWMWVTKGVYARTRAHVCIYTKIVLNWCSFSLDGLISPSIWILIWCIFCSALPFQQATADVCMSKRSWVTAGFVKLHVRKHKFIHSYHPHFLRPYIWHFLLRNTIRLQLNMLPFFQPTVSNDGFKLF